MATKRGRVLSRPRIGWVGEVGELEQFMYENGYLEFVKELWYRGAETRGEETR